MYKKVVVLQSCYFANLNLLPFLSFWLRSPSSLLMLPIVVIQKFCYHSSVTSHFSSPHDKRESWDREENTQSSPWDKYVNFSKLKLEINQKMVSGEVHKYLFSTVVKKEFNNSHLQLQHSTFFCFEAVARVLDDVSNKRLKFAD